ncbi:uncharacterized protein [Argopecten irradians]
MSGIEELKDQELTSSTSDVEPTRYRQGRVLRQKKSESFLDPFDLTVEVSEENWDEDIDEDDDYEPSFNVTIGPTDTLETVNFGDLEFDTFEEEMDNEPGEGPEDIVGTGIERILHENDHQKLTQDQSCIAFLEPLLVLAKTKISLSCQVKGCKEEVTIRNKFTGSALYLTWACSSGHTIFRWCSQPVLNRGLNGGDLLCATAILASGNNFSKISLFAKFCNLHFLSASSFERMQSRYLVPQIDQFWTDKQKEVLEGFKDKELVILGDGRMDSPGHCAQYCSYTVMENDTKKILSIVTLDKRETEKKSTNLELAGFKRTLNTLKEKKMNVCEVVTDAHLQIGALMKKDHKEIKHSHDIWHAAKNLGKKIIAAGQDKQCRPLQKWSRHVVNHFWYVCQNASTKDEFIGLWYPLIHHVVDEHEWLLPYSSSGTYACQHNTLEDATDKEWLVKDGPAHRALRKIIFDKRFINRIPYFTNFRSTAELENFQQHILMYAAKRFAYSPPVYAARNQLAALDYNANVGRAVKVNKDGKTRYRRMFNKKSGRWTVVTDKEAKNYDHIKQLLNRVAVARLNDREGMSGKQELSATDPRRISRTIAPVTPPPTSQLVEEKKSRLQ